MKTKTTKEKGFNFRGNENKSKINLNNLNPANDEQQK